MPLERSRSLISFSPEANKARPTSSNSSALLTSTTKTLSACHSCGRSCPSQAAPMSTTRLVTGGGAADTWLVLRRTSSSFVAPQVPMDQLRQSCSPRARPSNNEARSYFSSVLRRAGFWQALGAGGEAPHAGGGQKPSSSQSADFATVRLLKALQGYSRIRQSSSTSSLASARFSTTMMATPRWPSSVPTFLVMIFRKPRRSSR
mmetsp:Transcript_29539/g.80813  ORF Transcript_29539/g.80813 Transcript_29539/m.80813 type:complete len:204 (+) Transcript_29539:1157-1768(+)